MPDLRITEQRGLERAFIEPETDRGRDWINENVFIPLMTGDRIQLSLDGAVELELLARQAGLDVCSD